MFEKDLEYLATQAKLAAGPKFHHPKEEPENVYFMDNTRVTALPKPRDHQAADLDTVVAWAGDGGATWYSSSGVVHILNDDTRFDRVTLKLGFSDQLQTIMAWKDRSPLFTQAKLILALRTLFKRNMQQCPALLDLIRNLRFKTGSNVQSEIGKNKASISKSIESQVSGAEDLPADVFFNVPIFGRPFSNIEGLVNIAIEMDAGTETIVLYPIPGDVEKAIELAEAAIGGKLVEMIGDAGPVYHGVP